jgi:hypothetical protein
MVATLLLHIVLNSKGLARLLFIFIICSSYKKDSDFCEQLSLNNSSVYVDSFVAMGTIFKVSIGEQKKTIKSKQAIVNILIDIADKYETTFSDWSVESELAKLQFERSGKIIYPSPLFMEAMLISLKANTLTRGSFNIFCGSNSSNKFHEVSSATCSVHDGGRAFSVIGESLITFNGMIKGMCLGNMAKELYHLGVNNFSINAGNGDIVKTDTFPYGSKKKLKKIHFISRSHLYQHVDTRWFEHIKTENIVLEKNMGCVSLDLYIEDIENASLLGALCDAFSTAYVASNNKYN